MPAATNATAKSAHSGGAGWRASRPGRCCRRHPELGDDQDPASIDGVGDGAATEREDQDRDELDDASARPIASVEPVIT